MLVQVQLLGRHRGATRDGPELFRTGFSLDSKTKDAPALQVYMWRRGGWVATTCSSYTCVITPTPPRLHLCSQAVRKSFAAIRPDTPTRLLLVHIVDCPHRVSHSLRKFIVQHSWMACPRCFRHKM